LHRPMLSGLFACLLLIGYFTDFLTLNTLWQWSVINLHIPKHTVDLVSFTPWFAVVLLGSLVMHYHLLPQISGNKLTKNIAILGRHSLIIYVIHQPILFTGFYIVEFVFRPI
jgi:uncharacterized membrane protein